MSTSIAYTFLLSFAVLLVLPPAPINSLENGVARTPPMGWMTWQRFRCQTDCKLYPDECISEKLVKRTVKRLAEDGWGELGYKYIVVDDCWMSRSRDPKTHELIADKDRFPSGFEKLSEYVRGMGLKFGVYLDYGTYTCGGFPGSLDYLEVDADTMGKWKADYIKLDGCYSNVQQQPDGYAKFGRLLNATGRPLVYSCSYPTYHSWPKDFNSLNWTQLAENCNLWRMLYDVEDDWKSVKYIINSYATFSNQLAKYAGPGHWNDPDMLVVGNFGLSKDQQQTQMGMWCMFAAPLILSTDIDALSDDAVELLRNWRLIDIDQDPAGHQALLVKKGNNLQYWARPLGFAGSEHAIAVWFTAYGGSPIRLEATLADFGINAASSKKVILTDVFTGDETHLTIPNGKFISRINPHGLAMYHVKLV